MSALPRSRRHPVATKDPHFRPPPSKARRSASRDQSGTPLDSRSPSASTQIPNGVVDQTEDTSPQLSESKGSGEAQSHPRAPSENGSSELSELDEALDDDNGEMAAENNVKDVDSEAETERLDISPHKAQKQTSATSHQSNTILEKTVEHSIEARTVDSDDLGVPGSDATAIASPTGLSNRKRKRTSSFHQDKVEGEPKRKRSNSLRRDTRSPEIRRQALDGGHLEAAQEEADEAALDDASQDEDAEDVADQLPGSDDATPEPPGVDEQEDNGGDDDTPLRPTEDLADAGEDVDEGDVGEDLSAGVEETAETEHHLEMEGEDEDEEGEATAKSEDEIAKKKAAMDALIPIEKLFAVFRDKLFDERLANVAAELDLLTGSTTPTHPDFLAMRNAIDARRDEKIQLEQTALVYKIRTLENKILAERSQLHSQFFQTVRAVRENHMSVLNEEFCRIQRERRQWKPKEANYSIAFKHNRADLVAQQKAYNKEVSLLAGIAKHVGFPAAPALEPARPSEIEDDFKAMRLKTRPSTLVAQLASSSRADEVAAKEQFLESTPWANPKHPVHQQALLADRPPAGYGPIQNQRLSMGNTGNRLLVDLVAPPPPATQLPEPPSSIQQQTPLFQPAHMREINESSPLDHLKQRQENTATLPLPATPYALNPLNTASSQPSSSQQREDHGAPPNINGNFARIGQPDPLKAPHHTFQRSDGTNPIQAAPAGAEAYSFAQKAAAGALGT